MTIILIFLVILAIIFAYNIFKGDESYVSGLIFCIVAIAAVFMIKIESNKEELAVQSCKTKYGDREHFIEKLFTTTKSGCQIISVTKYSSECYEIDKVFVTDCDGVSWKERVGKNSHIERSNVNKK